MSPEFLRRGCSVHQDASLGGVVMAVPGRRAFSFDGGDIDDGAPIPLGDHLPGSGLGAEEGAAQIVVDDQVPLLFGHVDEGAKGLEAGIVNQDVKTAEMADCFFDEVGGAFLCTDVGRDRDGRAAEGFNLVDHGLRAGGAGTVVDDDLRSRCGKTEGNTAAQAAAAAGNDGHQIGEIEELVGVGNSNVSLLGFINRLRSSRLHGNDILRRLILGFLILGLKIPSSRISDKFSCHRLLLPMVWRYAENSQISANSANVLANLALTWLIDTLKFEFKEIVPRNFLVHGGTVEETG